MSQITTHVLDTSNGSPAEGIRISLQRPVGEGHWATLGSEYTNADGRVSAFLPAHLTLEPGIYRLLFETKAYFRTRKIQAFYPYIPIVFEIQDSEHYHVPLLLNPFGYSTYRGS